MGRKTYLSFAQQPLPGRTNIVVSRDPGFRRSRRAGDARSLPAALEAARGDALRRGVGTIMVVGGADIYAQTMARADRLEMTHVHLRPDGDTMFPAIDPARLARSGANRASRRAGRRSGLRRARFMSGAPPLSRLKKVNGMSRPCAVRAARAQPRCNGHDTSPITPPNANERRRLGRAARRQPMPWSNQGGGPWGSGGRQGPLGLRAATIGTDAARSRGVSAAQPGQAAHACCRAAISAARGLA